MDVQFSGGMCASQGFVKALLVGLLGLVDKGEDRNLIYPIPSCLRYVRMTLQAFYVRHIDGEDWPGYLLDILSKF